MKDGEILINTMHNVKTHFDYEGWSTASVQRTSDYLLNSDITTKQVEELYSRQKFRYKRNEDIPPFGVFVKNLSKRLLFQAKVWKINVMKHTLDRCRASNINADDGAEFFDLMNTITATEDKIASYLYKVRMREEQKDWDKENEKLDSR